MSITTRLKNRIKEIYRGQDVRTSGGAVYQARYGAMWLREIDDAGLRTSAGFLFRQLDQLQLLRREPERAKFFSLDSSQERDITQYKILASFPELYCSPPSWLAPTI
jgi:hypothetical protein